MIDDQQEMRQTLDETKAQLFAKLQLLEEQIAETVETTGSKVKSTVGAVESAVHSVSNALDVRGHFERHPWWLLGGAMAIGYLAAGARDRKGRDSKRTASGSLGIASLDAIDVGDSGHEADSAASLSALSAAYEMGSRQSTATQARSLALNATVRVVEEIVSRSIPVLIAHFTKKPADRS
jgi:hypothetical protein